MILFFSGMILSICRSRIGSSFLAMAERRTAILLSVGGNELRYLLNYQEKVLSELAYSLGIDVVAVAKEISSGNNFNTRGMLSLIHSRLPWLAIITFYIIIVDRLRVLSSWIKGGKTNGV